MYALREVRGGLPVPLHHRAVKEATALKEPTVLALGMFDGLHIGHQAVLLKTVCVAREQNAHSAVYTFANHPRGVFAQAPKLLMTPEERANGMKALGIEHVDMVVFDRAMAELSPEAFVASLCARYNLRAVVAGSDYTFGHFGAGNMNTLRALGAASGFAVYEVPFVSLDGEKVSSTRVREALAKGDVSLAMALLGNP